MQPRDEVEYILTECFIRLGQEIGELRVSPEAAHFWRERYRERFLITLTKEQPRMWARDRLNVLAKAAALGRLAAQFAREDGALVIEAKHALQASDANDCRPRSHYGEFGIWCIPPGKAAEEPERSSEPAACLTPVLGAAWSR
jgi:hypothetical protein